MSDFSNRLAGIIAAQDIKQTTLADALGVTQGAVSRWVSGKSLPEKPAIRLLAQQLGVDEQWLLKGSGENKINPLRAAREKAGLSLKQLSERTGYKIGVLQAIENGSRASEKLLQALELVLPEINAEEIMLANHEHPLTLSEHGGEGTFGASPKVQMPTGIIGRYVPLFSFAQAGAYAIESCDEGWTGEAMLAMGIKDTKAFALKVEGDSMSPHINPGDTIVTMPSRQPHRGDTVVVKTTDNEVFCKLWGGENADGLLLKSHNPAHPDLVIPRDQVRFIYPVAQVTKNLLR